VAAGTQESREWEKRGSQPPRQYAPTPHCPYNEQQGESSGQGFPGPHCVAAFTTEEERTAARAAMARERIMLSREYEDRGAVQLKPKTVGGIKLY